MSLLIKKTFNQTTMKKIITFICVIAVAITINSCKKRTHYYYAYCETGHAPWESRKFEYPANGAGAPSAEADAGRAATDHNYSIHGGVRYAVVRSGMY